MNDPLTLALRFSFAASSETPQEFLARVLAGFVGGSAEGIQFNGLDVTRDELITSWDLPDAETFAAQMQEFLTKEIGLA